MAEFILSAFADEGGNTIYEQIDALKANSITHIEPRGIDGVTIADSSSAQAKELKKILDDNGIGVSSIGSPFGKIQLKDDFNVHMEKFKQTVENACILGTQYIRMFSFYYDGYTAEEARDPVFERLEKLADYSLSCGIYCCHENEKDIYGDTEDRCRDILTTFKGKIKGIFDPANFIQCGVDILPAYSLLKDYIEYMHVKDARYSDGSVTPPGLGDGHIKELLTEFNKKDGKHFLTLEPHLKVFDGLENLEKSGGTIHKLKVDYTYPTNRDAFNAAASALHEVLSEIN